MVDAGLHAAREADLRAEDILASIRAIVADDCDVLEVHSSISALAGLRHAPRKWSFLKAIKTLVSEGKTLLFPAFTFSYTRGAGFELNGSPSETGILADWVLELHGAQRTPNPIFSFVVIGPKATQFLAADHRDAYGDASVLGLLRTCRAGALMLGASWNYLSYLHHMEQAMQVPYREYKTFHAPADLGQGPIDPKLKVFVRRSDVTTEPDFAAAGRAAEREGLVRRTGLGCSFAKFLRISHVTEICEREMATNPCFLLKDSGRVMRDINNLQLRAQQPAFRVALLGTENLDGLNHFLDMILAEAAPSRRFEIYSPDYGGMFREVEVAGSELEAFAPSATIFADTMDSICGTANAWQLAPDVVLQRFERWFSTVTNWIDRSEGTVILLRPIWAATPLSGDHTHLERRALKAKIDALIADLAEVLADHGGVLIEPGPLAAANAVTVADPGAWYVGRIPFSNGFSEVLSRRICGALLDLAGLTTRLIVVDMDNTIWGGVIGDDGVDGIALAGDFPGNAYREFQLALKSLLQRGVALAISSKNDEETVFAALDKHPDMVLRRADFVDHEIHWEPKANSISRIIERLNLSPHNVMFLDDNPTERAAVRKALPHVVVPELGNDPVRYCAVLENLPQLNGIRVTESDLKRVQSFHQMKAVSVSRSQATDHDAFIRELDVNVAIAPLTEGTAARAAQLMAKTNQFNSSVRRYDADALAGLQKDGNRVGVIQVSDRFSPPEIMGVMVLKQSGQELDSLVMSCRALGKGVETALIGHIAQNAWDRLARPLKVDFVETARNGIVKTLLETLHFNPSDDGWIASPETVSSALPEVTITGLEEHFP